MPVQPRAKPASHQAAATHTASSQPSHGLSTHMAKAGKWALIGAVALAGVVKVRLSPVQSGLVRTLCDPGS